MFNDIQALISDLDSRRSLLFEQMKEFESLQEEIKQLTAESGHSATAQNKLKKLEQAFPEGIDKCQKDILAKINSLEENFKVIEKTFKSINHEPDDGNSSLLGSDTAVNTKKKTFKSYI
ncbi:hypothetical protein QE197_00555 [Arsenophonus nasoniae]|uniref:Uncharacterized protein n=1 Tax=Arsenophonus nasoniae TaxID=638 RepID=A0A4V1BWC7_9GAMM|nr:hypothetical protein [Arsenophonus nasoniae]QBY41733.1 hypothetical protein ArsFIN_02610 [Arsenophonus nasoniae]WGL95017.1 hypothetical protein QE207_15320 [Arsenophonus nasoniae]WGM01865.1 hypothetical protein QE210_01685 [Arsenophonus nasoniae]WGM05918.1 hypothetical protein QE258_00565 [Arsenophonus nasoniae]WGM10928.1 hypothetical protein QE197_00555 [Arsenophonus nasoniae]